MIHIIEIYMKLSINSIHVFDFYNFIEFIKNFHIIKTIYFY